MINEIKENTYRIKKGSYYYVQTNGWESEGKRNDVGETEGRYCEGKTGREIQRSCAYRTTDGEGYSITSSLGYETISDCEGTQYRSRICLPVSITDAIHVDQG